MKFRFVFLFWLIMLPSMAISVKGKVIIKDELIKGNIYIVLDGYELDNEKNSIHKRIKLKNGGYFKLKLKKEGTYFIKVDLDDNKDKKYKNYNCFLNFRYYVINAKKGTTYFPNDFIFIKKIIIKNPSDYNLTKKPKLFEWSPIQNCDLYELKIFLHEDNKVEPQGLNINLITKNYLIYLEDVENNNFIISEKFDADLIRKNDTVIFKNKILKSGRYGLSIVAYNITTDNKLEFVTKSDYEYFKIETIDGDGVSKRARGSS
ncbi:MAG: hypothetical protein MJB14_21140 [Spirochaetes bacterium]|nr:hypothetical protein [Spirochaetota bacterium]